LFYIYPFKPNGILFPEGFFAPVRNPARLAVKKYRKRSEDDYFTATSPQEPPCRASQDTGLPLPEEMKCRFLLILFLLFHIAGKTLFEWLKISCRCNVMSYGVTYRTVCKSIN